jgi:hypothetical protein
MQKVAKDELLTLTLTFSNIETSRPIIESLVVEAAPFCFGGTRHESRQDGGKEEIYPTVLRPITMGLVEK